MRHTIPLDEVGPQAQSMADAVGACVHCGFCLPTCPTYVTMGEEMDSPRGRIFLMKEVLEGALELETVLPYIDNCLGCQACQTACPSGVQYGELLTPFRAYAEDRRRRSPLERVQREMTLRTLAYPRWFRVAVRLGQAVRPVAGLLPPSMSAALRLIPDRLPKARRLPDTFPAAGQRRARVALLAGCAQQVLDPDINLATLRVLARNGVETVIPGGQGCCGALAMHTGAAGQAKTHARRNLETFPDDVDAVVTNSAGCGSAMREYGLLFRGEPEEEAARKLADRTVDVSVFLAGLGLTVTPPALSSPLTIAYHDACHLAHAQRVRREPRNLLRAIEGVSLTEPAEWQLCCGSAGTYSLEKPDVAQDLGRRKIQHLLETGAQLIASGNIGCLTQLQTHLRRADRQVPVMHTVQVLDRAYTRTLPERK
jgi:glycolate oxidase iron-sulfur subunit